jgi:hypothetical protein
MKKETKITNFGHTVTIIILLIVIAGMIIVFVNQYSTYSSDYIAKASLSKFYIKKDSLGFSDLPQHIKMLYTSKVDVTKTEERLNDNIKMVEKSTIDDMYLDNITLVTQIECDNFRPTSHIAPLSCKSKLTQALSKMNDNMIYEIIPMVNNRDFKFIQRMVSENLNENEKIEYKEQMNDFVEYANRGLSHYRSNEAVWILKQNIGKSVKIRHSSFHMFTKDKAGFILKIFNYIE